MLLFKLAKETTYTPFHIEKEYKKFLEDKTQELQEKQRKISCEIRTLKRAISKL